MKKMDGEEVNKPHKYNRSQDGSDEAAEYKEEMSEHTPKIPPETKNTHVFCVYNRRPRGNTSPNETQWYWM